MEVTQINADGLKREFRVVLAGTDLAGKVEGQLAEFQAKARIPGFRPGKVPVSHLKRLYGRSILAEVVQEAINEANKKIIEDNQLQLAVNPKIEFAEDSREIEKVFSQQADLAFTVAVEVLPKIEVGSLEDLEVERPVAKVTDEEVEQALAKLAEQNRAYEPKGDEAAAAPTDKATLDFTGKIDGELFAGGKGENVDVILGAGSLLPDFETQIVGMKIGQERTFPVVFPENYSVKHLAGKTATFEVVLKNLATASERAIDDEFAKGFGLENLSALKDRLRETIERDFSRASRAKWKRGLLDALDERYQFNVPEGMLQQEFAGIWKTVENEQKQSGRSFEDEKTTEEAARAEYFKIAERRVRLGLLLAEIGQKAEVTVSDDEVNQALAQRARAFPGQEQAIWNYYQKNPQALAEIRAPLFEEKVIDYIVSQARVIEKSVPKEELFEIDEEKSEQPSGTTTAELG
ncbi:MAG TPA: trigger factor [Methylocella sp.]|nr:trigger factor [Methylocella sp.]